MENLASKLNDDFFAAAMWTAISGFAISTALDAQHIGIALTASAAALGSVYMTAKSAHEFVKTNLKKPRP